MFEPGPDAPPAGADAETDPLAAVLRQLGPDPGEALLGLGGEEEEEEEGQREEEDSPWEFASAEEMALDQHRMDVAWEEALTLHHDNLNRVKNK